MRAVILVVALGLATPVLAEDVQPIVGSIDAVNPETKTITGWACSTRTNQQPSHVKLWYMGSEVSGAGLLSGHWVEATISTTLRLSRPDVAAAIPCANGTPYFGYQIAITSPLFNGHYTLYLQWYDAGVNNHVLQQPLTMTIWTPLMDAR